MKRKTFLIISSLIIIVSGPYFLSLNVVAQEHPDLYVQDITASPLNPDYGQITTFTCRVWNNGNIDSSSGCYLALYVDNTYIRNDYIYSSDLPEVGNYKDYSLTWTAIPGNYDVKMVIDTNNDIEESNEDNNQKTVSINVKSPDLIVSDIVIDPDPPVLGSSADITVFVKNIGSCSSQNGFYFKVYVNGDCINDGYYDDNYFSELEIGAISSKTYTSTLYSKLNSIKVVVDTSQNVIESNEINNEMEIMVEASEAPALPPTGCDLIVHNITFSNYYPFEGEEIKIYINIRNIGNRDCSKYNFEIFINGGSVSSQSFSAGYYNDNDYLSPEEIDLFEYSWKDLTSGFYYVKVIIDKDETINEIDDSNNEATVGINVSRFPKEDYSGYPDIIVSDISFNPPNPGIDDWFSVIIEIKNIGLSDSSKFEFSYYYDGKIDKTEEVTVLKNGAVTMKTMSEKKMTSGIHKIKVIADPKNSLKERDDNNNDMIVYISPGGIIIPLDEIERYNGTYNELRVTLGNDGKEHTFIKTTEPELWKNENTFWSTNDALNKREYKSSEFTILEYDLDDMELYKKGSPTSLHSEDLEGETLWYYDDFLSSKINVYILTLPYNSKYISSSVEPDEVRSNNLVWYNTEGQEVVFKSNRYNELFNDEKNDVIDIIDFNNTDNIFYLIIIIILLFLLLFIMIINTKVKKINRSIKNVIFKIKEE